MFGLTLGAALGNAGRGRAFLGCVSGRGQAAAGAARDKCSAFTREGKRPGVIVWVAGGVPESAKIRRAPRR